MFDMIQHNETEEDVLPRTLVYVVVHGEPLTDGSGRISERGREQVVELVRSRAIGGVSRIYSSPSNAALVSAGILRRELDVPVTVRECLAEVSLGKGDINTAGEQVIRMWDDPSFRPAGGESIDEAQMRFGTCMNIVVSAHPNDSVVVVTHPMVSALFMSLVRGGPPLLEDWLYMGYASFAIYEYARGSWMLSSPHDDSFLSDPRSVASCLPEDVRSLFGL